MTLLEETLSRIAPPDAAIAGETQRRLDGKTKPRQSLGRLEEIACHLAAISGNASPPLPEKAIVVMGADHGIAAEGVSAYPQEVTRQMLLNFAGGGAAINVLARHAGARVVVVDMGVREPLPATPALRACRIGPGTASFLAGSAMSRAQATEAIEAGIRIADELFAEGVGMVALGDMGIGNTTSSSALTAVLTGAPPEEVTGRGTGIDDRALAHKIDVIRRAIAHNRPDANDGLDVLAKLGGFEIAGLAGVALGAASHRLPVVIDGFITSAAALVAARLQPSLSGYLLAAHRSVEKGHRFALQALGTRPLLDLDLRLGEGTGAALAFGLIDAALRILHEMATFESAGVSDSGA